MANLTQELKQQGSEKETGLHRVFWGQSFPVGRFLRWGLVRFQVFTWWNIQGFVGFLRSGIDGVLNSGIGWLWWVFKPGNGLGLLPYSYTKVHR